MAAATPSQPTSKSTRIAESGGYLAPSAPHLPDYASVSYGHPIHDTHDALDTSDTYDALDGSQVVYDGMNGNNSASSLPGVPMSFSTSAHPVQHDTVDGRVSQSRAKTRQSALTEESSTDVDGRAVVEDVETETDFRVFPQQTTTPTPPSLAFSTTTEQERYSVMQQMSAAGHIATASNMTHMPSAAYSRRWAWWVANSALLALVVAIAALGLVASSGGGSTSTSTSSSTCSTALSASETCAMRVSKLQEQVAQLETELNMTVAVLAAIVDKGIDTQARLANLSATAQQVLPTMLQNVVAECEAQPGGAFHGYQTLDLEPDTANVICATRLTPTKLAPLDGAARDRFGFSAAANADNLVVLGAPLDDTANGGDDSGAVYLYRINSGETDASPLSLLAKLTAHDGTANDFFGWSLALSGDVLVVGAYGADALTGAVYLYRVNTTAATAADVAVFLGKIVAEDGSAADYFGVAVAIEHDLVAIGAHSHDITEIGNDSGAVYLYRVNDTTSTARPPEFIAKIFAHDGVAADLFGSSVAISPSDGNADPLVVVGAYRHVVNGTRSGAVYVYRLRPAEDSRLQFLSKLAPADGIGREFFGYALAMGQAGLVAVGAHGSSHNGPNSGAAYLFTVNASSESNAAQFVAKLAPEASEAGDEFGIALALGSDGLLVVGAFRDDTAHGEQAGSAYVFRLQDRSTPQLVTQLVAEDGAAGDGFGRCVAASGAGSVIVGAYLANVTAEDSGAAYVYTPPG